ncbi:MAG TPA: tyrosine recombinase [Micromonosporaceae bacterium]|nr:tyrosine recombinase [Micromonosporaceae bacterium]
MGGYLDHLTVERALAANTLAAYRRDLNRYADWLAAAAVPDLASVTQRRIAAFLATLREGDPTHPPLAAASAARAMSAVRGLHRFAVREGLAPDDPSVEITPPVPAKRLPKALSVNDVLKLLAAAGAAPAEPLDDTAPAHTSTDGSRPRVVTGDLLALRDRALLEFLYGTGARISEAVGLDRDDVDLPDSSVVLHGKGGRTRLVPIGSYAAAALDAYLVRARPALAAAGRGTAATFLNARGGRLSRQSAWTILRRAADAAGLDATRISPHTLRHSYATHLLDGGADVRVVQELLGHASVTTTQVYTLVTVEHLREVYVLAHPRARE